MWVSFPAATLPAIKPQMAKTRTTPRTAKTTQTQTETPLSEGFGVSPPLSSVSSPGTTVEFSLTASTVLASSVLFYAVSSMLNSFVALSMSTELVSFSISIVFAPGFSVVFIYLTVMLSGLEVELSLTGACNILL